MSDIPWSTRGFLLTTSRPTRALAWVWSLAPLFLVVALWQLALGTAPSLWVARPTDVMARIWQLLSSGDLIKHGSFTVWHAIAGLLLSMIVGVPIGIALASYAWLARGTKTILLGLYSLPRIALAPLFILWFGIGDVSKIVMTCSMVVFVVILNTYQGLSAIDRELVDMFRTMRASPFYTFRKISVPTLAPWILASLRVGIGLALVGSVIGEMLGSNRGLGWYVEYCAARFDVVGVFAGLIILMTVGMALNWLVDLAETRSWNHRV